MGELVDVLMPVGPNSAWLPEALSSLSRQSCGDWRLVLVLDGAPDSAEGVLVDSGVEGRTTVIRTAGVGVTSALNVGLRAVEAPYVMRLDADDVCEPSRLATQLQAMRERPALVALGTAATLIDEHGDSIGLRPVPVGARAVRRTLMWRTALIHPSVLVRTEALHAVGGYNERCQRSQDYELWLRLLKVGDLDNLAKPLLRYRISAGQHSRPILLGADSVAIWRARRAVGGERWRDDFVTVGRHLAWSAWQYTLAIRTKIDK